MSLEGKEMNQMVESVEVRPLVKRTNPVEQHSPVEPGQLFRDIRIPRSLALLPEYQAWRIQSDCQMRVQKREARKVK